MDKENILLRVKEYLVETFDIDQNDPEFDDEIDFFAYGYVDSFGAAQIISFMEEEFSIEVTGKDLVKYPMTSVEGIARYIMIKLEG